MSVTDLCHEYGISRPTAYKWIKRYNEVGPEGLLDISRKPHGCAHATSLEVENEILALRKRFPSWGARKLKARLEKMNPNVVWPAASTVGQILRRAGLTNPVRKRRRTTPYSEPFAEVTAPNQLWCMDFKGWFRTGDGNRCDPFTITDAYSRYLIRCQAVARMDTAHVLAICEAAMREYGVPERIRTDNGNPFSGLGVMGLSRLSLSWVRLGIVHERIQPGKPQQNGRHERMHRTLKQDTTNPSAKTLHAQQKRFDEFVRVYNHERPHEALGNETPGSIYVPSSRLLPRYTKAHQYPVHFQTRRVNDAGDISWHKSRVFISEVFRGEDIALEKVEENFYRVYFCSLEVGEFNVDDMRFRPGLRP
jgi:transposase InsO family protein